MTSPSDPIVADAYERHRLAILAWRELPEQQRKGTEPGWSDAHDAAFAAAKPAAPSTPSTSSGPAAPTEPSNA